MNKVTLLIHNKGWTLKQFLEKIGRKTDWYYEHSNGGKDYDFLILAIDGLSARKGIVITIDGKAPVFTPEQVRLMVKQVNDWIPPI